MLTDPTRRDADANCINRNRTGECEGSVESISLSYFRGRSWEGESISPWSTFFTLSTTCVCPLLFILLYPDVREISLFEYSFNKSLDIPFFNSSIFPETSLHPRITHDLFPSFFILLHFIVREISVWAHDCPTIWQRYPIIPVYSYPLLIRFAHYAAFAGPFLRRMPSALIHLYRLTGNGSHNHPWLLLWSRYIAVGVLCHQHA